MTRSSPPRRVPVLVALLALLAHGCDRTPSRAVGSKVFTESVILAEMATLAAKATGADVQHRRELGGTRILYNALRAGEIDAYPEYTGTLREEILHGRIEREESLAPALREDGILMTERLGFNNGYALGMKKARAAKLGIETISDLRRHPDLRVRFSNEFMDRADGWRSLRESYDLPHRDVRGVDHDIAYRALEDGSADVTVLYTTDAEIRYYDLKVLEDDREHFPRYDAVFIYRAELEEEAPELVRALERFSGLISEEEMVAMNARAKVDRVPESIVAADFLRDELGIEVTPDRREAFERIWRRTLEHLYLVGVSLLAAVAVSIPLGIWAAKSSRAAPLILGAVGIIQTIPALALLVFLMPVLRAFDVTSLGEPPALVALFLYSLLPIVRNTCTGLQGISPAIIESAKALGLPAGARLRLVELPLASPTILAGIKTAAVINIGFATLGALIGAGGYGQPILTGIRLDDIDIILEGAVPAALMALGAQGLFSRGEKALVPRGLRIEA